MTTTVGSLCSSVVACWLQFVTLLGVRLPVVNCMYNKMVDSYPSHLRVVRFRILFVVRAERSVRFYNEWGSWLDVLTLVVCCGLS